MISFRRLPIALAMAALACSAQAQSLLALVEQASGYDAAWQSARAQLDAALGDADIAHPRHHVVQQRLELLVVGLGIVADPSEDQHALVAGGMGRRDEAGEQCCADRGQRQAEPGCTQR